MKQQRMWIYQDSNSASPWALNVRATKKGRTIKANSTLYADWLKNKQAELHQVNINFDDEFINELNRKLLIYNKPLSESDKLHISQNLDRLRKKFID